MDWSKINKEEVDYYCTSWKIDFDCYPFSLQIECIIMMLFYYHIYEFTINDIHEFYHKMRIKKVCGEGFCNPSSSQILKAINRIKNVQYINNDCFKILYADTKIFEDAIKK